MKLDSTTLMESPLLARLVTEGAIKYSGALELLSDDYKPPQPPILRIARPEDEDAEEAPEPEVPEAEAEAELVTEIVEANPSDTMEFPAIINVKAQKATPSEPAPDPRGVSLIRPRTLADMGKAAS